MACKGQHQLACGKYEANIKGHNFLFFITVGLNRYKSPVMMDAGFLG